MADYREAFVAFDVAKIKHAVAVADSGRAGEVRFLGEIENRPVTIERTIRKLAKRYDRLHVCFEAGPTGYGLYRQVGDLGHDCMVVAPALIPKRSGERIKTNRRESSRLTMPSVLTGNMRASGHGCVVASNEFRASHRAGSNLIGANFGLLSRARPDRCSNMPTLLKVRAAF
jgi:hypothetical protein